MARANVKTLLSLDRFAAVLNIMPLHFNQVFLRDLPNQPDGTTARTCDVPIVQFSYQTAGKIGREDIAQAIADAEAMIIPKLGYLPAVDWVVDEQVSSIRPSDPRYFNGNNLDVRGYFTTVQARNGMVISGGQAAKTLIGADEPVVYTDADGDGYFETATVSIPTTVTDGEELRIYFPGQGGDDAWEIRPLVSVVIAAGVATIVFKREQCVTAALQLTYFPTGLSGTDNANFLTTVDVYRKYNDPSVQSQFIWDTVGGGICDCGGVSNCNICGYSVQDGCMVVRNPRLGIVSPQPGTWDSAAAGFDSAAFAVGRQPDRFRLWYRSGWRNMALVRPNVSMDPLFERAIAVLALTLLSRPLCNCEPLESAFRHWQEDLAHNESTQPKSSSFRGDPGLLRNPFGTTRGANYAWAIVSERMIGRSAISA